MAAAEAEARAAGWPMAIAIVDSAGHLVLFQKLDQTNLGAVAIAQRKAEAAALFRRATKVFEDVVTSTPGGLRLLSLGAELVAVEGGVPLLEGGAIVGAIGVSGMQSAQDGQPPRGHARSAEGRPRLPNCHLALADPPRA
jgi:uncharacterized protein GlcG (DUF336 family)